MKQGADKHRITENSEILALFQDSGSYQPDAAEVNGKEFKVTISRTIQKSDSTTQKRENATQKDSLKDRNTTQKDSLKDSNTILKTDVTTQKSDSTTQKEALKDSDTIQKSDSTIQKEVLKDSDTIQKSNSTIQKDLDPSQVRVLNFFREHPKATIDEMVAELNDLSLGGVKFIIAKLQKKGLLKRVGGRKHGEWQVLI